MRGVLAQLDAALGRKEDAIREPDRATELLPIEKDAIGGPQIAALRTNVYGQVGETDRGPGLLGEVVGRPFAASYGELKLDRKWDPWRKDPRFEKMVQTLAPK